MVYNTGKSRKRRKDSDSIQKKKNKQKKRETGKVVGESMGVASNRNREEKPIPHHNVSSGGEYNRRGFYKRRQLQRQCQSSENQKQNIKRLHGRKGFRKSGGRSWVRLPQIQDSLEFKLRARKCVRLKKQKINHELKTHLQSYNFYDA